MPSPRACVSSPTAIEKNSLAMLPPRPVNAAPGPAGSAEPFAQRPVVDRQGGEAADDQDARRLNPVVHGIVVPRARNLAPAQELDLDGLDFVGQGKAENLGGEGQLDLERAAKVG